MNKSHEDVQRGGARSDPERGAPQSCERGNDKRAPPGRRNPKKLKPQGPIQAILPCETRAEGLTENPAKQRRASHYTDQSDQEQERTEPKTTNRGGKREGRAEKPNMDTAERTEKPTKEREQKRDQRNPEGKKKRGEE